MANTKNVPAKTARRSQYEALLSYWDAQDIKHITTGKKGKVASAAIPCFACGQEVMVINSPGKIELRHISGDCSDELMLGAIGWTTDDLTNKTRIPPSINVSSQTSGDLPFMVRITFDCLSETNKPETLFQFQGHMLRVRDLDGRPIMEILDDDKIEYELSRRITFFRVEDEKTITVLPPRFIIRGLRSCPDNPLPTLERIIESPVFTMDGSLHKTKGYSPHSRCYYVPSGKLVIKVPQNPSEQDVKNALELIQEVFCDFPIVGEPSKANHLATVLTPFARNLIGGPIPMSAYSKPKPGSGASLIVDALSLIATGREAEAISACEREEEWDKQILATLRNGPEIILIDNLKGKLDSGVLAKALTRTTYTSRELSRSHILTVPNRSLWIVTGNNIKTSDEMARRILFVLIDANMPNPELRDPTQFKHPRLLSWIRDNRGRIISACLTIIKKWLAEGRPLDPRNPSLGMFEEYSSTMGGILYCAGVPGFLDKDDLKKRRTDFDSETSSVLPLIDYWWDTFKDREIKVSDFITDVVMQAEGTEDIRAVFDFQDRRAAVKLGLRIGELQDQVFDVNGTGVKLVFTRTFRGTKHYRLIRVDNS